MRPPSTHPDEPLTVDLYLRNRAAHGLKRPQETVVERLETLRERGAIAEFSVHFWSDNVQLDSVAARSQTGQHVRETVATFEEWAEEQGLSVSSFFERRSVDSSYTGETYTSLILPVMTVAEYLGDDLRFVAPSSDGETVVTVKDRLDALERLAEPPERDSPERRRTAMDGGG